MVRLGSAALPKIENDGGAEQGKVARVPISDLFAPGIRRKWAVIASLWFLTYFVSYGLVNWVPSIYVSVFDIPISEALTYTSIGAVAMFFLPLVLRQIIDKVGRRPPAYVGMMVGGAAMLTLMAVPGDAWLWAVCLLIIGQVGISFGALVLVAIHRRDLRNPGPCGGARRIEQPGARGLDVDAAGGRRVAASHGFGNAGISDFRGRIHDRRAALVVLHHGDRRQGTGSLIFSAIK